MFDEGSPITKFMVRSSKIRSGMGSGLTNPRGKVGSMLAC